MVNMLTVDTTVSGIINASTPQLPLWDPFVYLRLSLLPGSTCGVPCAKPEPG
jgi:hypothetical protein